MKTLLKFEADWCGPCQQIKPIVHDVIDNQQDVALENINIEDVENRDLVLKHGVRAIPTLVLLDDNQEVIRVHRGTLNKGQLQSFIAA